MALIDRIKFDGLATKNWLVYKYPGEDFVMGAQLIVNEGQIVVFLKGGQACDIFMAGTHTLSTANLPLLKSIVNIPFGGQTPFTAEIYFINRTTKLDMAWGTVDPIQIVDPKYKVKLRVRGFGQFGLRISDYRSFLVELIGAMGSNEVVSFEKVLKYFKGLLMTKIKTIIADAIINRGISALEISAKLEEVSNYGMEKVSAEFKRFGLEVVNFFVESINFPDEDFEMINKILSDRAAFDIIGDARYVSKRSFDVLETMASNEGTAGTIAGAGMGLGVGLGVGAAMGNSFSGVTPIQPAAVMNDHNQILCPKCSKPNVSGSAFCNECGTRIQDEKINCPGCKKEINKAQKFCNFCGQLTTPQTCSKCSAVIQPGSKFCSECGNTL